jgi:hypothetical protein
MLRPVPVAVALAAILLTASGQAQAGGAAPWCAVINTGLDMHWDCRYASFEACYPNVISGNRGFCNENPAYEGPAAPPRKTARRHRARNY